MTGYVNLDIDQGSSFSYEITLSDDQTNTSINIASYTFAAAMKRSFETANVAANLTCAIVSAGNGVMNIALTQDQTANLKEGRYYYDVKATAGGITDRLLEGVIYVSPRIS